MLSTESRWTSSPQILVGRLDYADVMATCFCGCEREIEGIRRRAGNELASQMLQDLTVMQGALERTEAGSRTAQTQAMVDEGEVLVAATRRYLHGEVERGELDRGRVKTWAKEARALAKTLVEDAVGPAWEPHDHRTNHLAQSGQRATGVITDVRRKGWGNDQVASLQMWVSARTADGTEVGLTRQLSISAVKAPRIGEAVEVSYDPDDPNRFVYRPIVDFPAVGSPVSSAASPPGDRASQLRELADLFEQGLLTRDEFDAEKARLLAE
jgi:hypothetical protein